MVLWSIRQKLKMHRLRRYKWVGRLLRKYKVDKFKTQSVKITFHRVTAVDKIKTIVRVIAGDEKIHTHAQVDGAFEETLSLIVEQGVGELHFDLLDAGNWRRQALARATLSVAELSSCTNKVVRFKKTSGKLKENPKLNLGIVLGACPSEDPEVGETSYLLAHKKTTKQKIGEEHKSEDLTVSAKRKAAMEDTEVQREDLLHTLVHACQGPLRIPGDDKKERDRHVYWVKIFGSNKCGWHLGWWADQPHADSDDQSPIGSIALRSIDLIYADPAKADLLMIQHTKANPSVADEHIYDILTLQHTKHPMAAPVHGKLFGRRPGVGCHRDVWVSSLKTLVGHLEHTRRISEVAAILKATPSHSEKSSPWTSDQEVPSGSTTDGTQETHSDEEFTDTSDPKHSHQS